VLPLGGYEALLKLVYAYQLLSTSVQQDSCNEGKHHMKIFKTKKLVASDLITSFLRDLPMTKFSNTHALYHLADDVREHGPTWTFSCWPLESVLGDLKLQSHSHQVLEKQLSWVSNFITSLPLLLEKASQSPQRQEKDTKVSRDGKSHKRDGENEVSPLQPGP
jgi:hypothetical protein